MLLRADSSREAVRRSSRAPLTRASPERTMRLMKLGSCTLMVLLSATSMMSAGCEEEKPTVNAAESEPEQPAKPKIQEGGACTANEECAERLGCAPDKKCRPFKTIECMGRVQACKKEGRCKGSDKGCVAGSNEDCKVAEVCKEEGRCTAKEGKCTVGSDADCATLCKEQGRCTVEDGKCIAGSNADCKESLECSGHGKCIAKNGLCAKAPHNPEDDW